MASSSPLTSIPSSSLRVLASLLRLPPQMMATSHGDIGELPAKWLAQQKQVIDSGVLPAELLSNYYQDQQSRHDYQLLSPRWNLGKGLVQTLVITPLLAPFLLSSSSSGGGHNHTVEHQEVSGLCLCEAHSALNKDLISEIYHLVKKEVVVHGEGVRSWLRHVSRHEQEYKDQYWGDMRGYVEVMVGIVTLMEEFQPGNGRDEEKWERYFGRGVGGMEYMQRRPGPGPGFERVNNGCMACVLAVVGGRKGLVVGLRGSCLGRARRRTPKLLGRWLGGWAGGFDVEEQREIQGESEEIAGRIREVRGLQRERFRGVRGGEWVSPRLVRGVGGLGLGEDGVPEVWDQGQEEVGAEGGGQQYEDDGNERRGSNNPYHQPAENKSPSPLVSSQPGPFGGFDGALDDDDDYRRIIDDIIPDRHHIHSPSPIPTPSPILDKGTDKRRGYIPPRQSWTAYPPPLFSPHYHPHHRPGNPDPQSQYDYPSRHKAKLITPPLSSSESHYADEIYDHYHTGDLAGKEKLRTKASTIFSGRPRPEEYDSLITGTMDREASLSSQHQRRLNDCYSERSMKSRLKRRLEGSSPRSEMSSSGKTQWVDFF